MGSETGQVVVEAAKGRPMLTWVGKKPLSQAPVYPAQLAERFDPTGQAPSLDEPTWAAQQKAWQNLLFYGDNKDVLAWLLANGYRGKVNLVYIDPPFDSGADYVRQVKLRGQATAQLEGEGYSLGEQVQYTDIWSNDNYLQFMYERLLLLRELLAENGAIWLHCDWHKNHHLRCLLDEVFGLDAFINEVIWQKIRASKGQARGFGNVHDGLFWYGKDVNSAIMNPAYVPYAEAYVRSHYSHIEEKTGRRYQLADMTQSGRGEPRQFGDLKLVPPPGKHWIWSQSRIDAAMSEERIVFTSGGTPRLKRYLDESLGNPVEDIWTDVFPVNSQALERTDFVTQKPEALLERVINASSNAGDLVLDCFIGSGTTAAVAQKLGRRWIGCDINKGAIQTTSKRLQTIINEQTRPVKGQPRLTGTEEASLPASLAFATYRVNDYDLQLQHNEAVELACQHIGVERNRTDSYFDGTYGKQLVKIVPMTHPLTLLDLEQLKDELGRREQEERAVMLVCLGQEPAVEGWVADWNRSHPINKLSVVELRTDAKYGGFFVHQPAEATVTVTRKGDKLLIKVEDFVSPAIITRLEQQYGGKAQVDDWRQMVDCVLIDTNYDGKVFNIGASDVPEKKSDLVDGAYELPACKGKTTVAVKVIDMLGEEVLVTADV